MMLTVRQRQIEDEPAVNALFRASFGHEPEAGYWAWKYQQLPGKSRSMVAVLADGRITAHVGALALPAICGGQTAHLWQLVDFMGSTTGLGLRPPVVVAGRQLLASLPEEDDHPWIFGFPSERHFALGSRAFGYRPLRMVLPLTGPLPTAKVLPGTLVEASDSCGDWAQSAWEGCGVASTVRSAGFLNWRYHARPGRYYRFYRLESGGQPGLAVFGFHGEQAMAAELWLPPSGDWKGPLLAVAADLAAMGLRTWSFWPEPRNETLLAGMGLSAQGDVVRVGRRGGADEDPSLVGFCFSMGDFDLI